MTTTSVRRGEEGEMVDLMMEPIKEEGGTGVHRTASRIGMGEAERGMNILLRLEEDDRRSNELPRCEGEHECKREFVRGPQLTAERARD